jgi:lysophospholipase L1-like esterase
MYRFQVRANTQPGEYIAIVGSVPKLGMWSPQGALPLSTDADRYPLWTIELDPSHLISAENRLEYQYLHVKPGAKTEWESHLKNRSVPIEPTPEMLVIDNGYWGTIEPYCYGYYEQGTQPLILPQGPQGLKVVIVGSSVAAGCSSWKLRGWSWLLQQELHRRFGHQVLNHAKLGANVTNIIDWFDDLVRHHRPDIVIIALSLGNEGLASVPAHEYKAVQRRFESGLQKLLDMTRSIGALPMLGGVYPNGHYNKDHYAILLETHHRMMCWEVPVFNWLSALDNGQGRWKTGIAFDHAHPNTEGHRLMFAAIPLELFNLDRAQLEQQRQKLHQPPEVTVFNDPNGFHVLVNPKNKSLRIINPTRHPYIISPAWQDLQEALKTKAKLLPGIYTTKQNDRSLSFFVKGDQTIENLVEIPPGSDVEYHATFHLFSPKTCQILFYDGQIGLLKEDDQRLRVLNETNHEYNIHPMWKEVRSALKGMPPGVYKDAADPEREFGTMMIGKDGLESRIKAPPKSSLTFTYRSDLAAISRVGIIPLGDRCAVRMLLYKLELDGPAYPFDLTRTTLLSDVADIIENRFHDMWNPHYLRYNPHEKRMYHTKWTGLSFAHEVEDSDQNMYPVFERMKIRYTNRSERFWYTLKHANELLFIRTGVADRNSIIDIVEKLERLCAGKPFRFMLISLQDGRDIADIPHVLHYCFDFNPDRMYQDEGYWMECARTMGSILNSLGVSSKNLFWCPPNASVS